MNSPKYNRTFHLPWSKGATNDDKIAKDVSHLIGVPIVISEKIDGSNVALERENCFARTHSGPPTHSSFNELKVLHATVKNIIEPKTQIFGEWCLAKHSIEYKALPHYFLLFGVRHLLEDSKHFWSGWSSTSIYASELGVGIVPTLFEGTIASEKDLQKLTELFMSQPSYCDGIREGVVVRKSSGFEDSDFSSCVMKCVRANHVQTSEHWKDQAFIKNGLKNG